MRPYVRPLIADRGPLALMTFAIGLANQISALAMRFGKLGLCLTGMSSRGVIVARASGWRVGPSALTRIERARAERIMVAYVTFRGGL